MKSLKLAIGSALLIALSTTAAFAADADITGNADGITGTSLAATVTEQCDIEVPGTIPFNVIDTDQATTTATSVNITNIVLASSSRNLRLSIIPSEASFTNAAALTDGGGTTIIAGETWVSSDVTWNAPEWSQTGATPELLAARTLGAKDIPVEFVTSGAGATTCNSTGLEFTLASKTTVKRSGSHTLAVTWKVESTD